MSPKVKVAVVQSEPDWFNLQGSVEKTKKLIIEAAANEAELIGFPEVFITGYPLWLWANAADIPRNVSYIENSLSLDSPEFQSIIDTIKANPIHVVLGFSERDHGSVYISQVIIDKTGEVKLKRRKMKPTSVERVIYGDGKASDLKSVVKLDFKEAGSVEVGCLSCWEHMQPLLTFNSAAQQEKIHIGSWPTCTDDDKDIYSLTKASYNDLAKAYALQTGTFYLFTSQLSSDKLKEALPELPKYNSRGDAGAAIYSPDGAKITEDLPDSFDGILYHELDMQKILVQKQLVDIVGHYSRTDMISLATHFDQNEKVSHI